MYKLNAQLVKCYPFNGNVDDGDKKFVEIDGKKFEADEKGEAKKDDAGNLVPFEDKKQDDPAPKLEELDLEALAKVNPHVARMLSEKQETEKKLAEQAKADEEKARKEAEAKGEWQKIADEEKKKREELEAQLATKNEHLSKYITSTETILKEVLATIPKERLALIPDDFSPRQKLEYVAKNAKLLGAKITVNANGEKIPNNEGTPSGTDEEKLVNEIEELIKKSPRTAIEDKLLYEKSVELKKLRAEKNKQ